MNRPLWTEGTLLCPQHMQQQDLYHERHLAARLAAALPHPWGVSSLRFDPAALQSGQLALTHLRAVLPDGTCIDLDDRSPGPPTRPLAPHFAARNERVPVWLTIPVLRPGVVNSAAQPTAQHRYHTITRDHFDLSLTRSARPLEQSAPNLALRLGDEPRDDLVCLPLAEVIRDPGGSFVLDDAFLPPITHVAAAPALRAALQGLCALVGARRRTLADDRRRQHDLPRALFFHALSGALPLLRHLADSQDTTPLQLYQHLLRLAGELRSFNTEITDTSEPAPYDFHDLRASLAPLLAELRQQVVDTLPDRFLRVPLEPRADGLWIGELRDDRLLRCTSYVLAVEAEADPAVLADELPALTRIAAWRRINLIVRNNVLGAPIRAVSHPPVELPVLPRHAYFTITPDDPSWLEVLRERNVAVYLPRPYDPERARITLMAIPGEA